MNENKIFTPSYIIHSIIGVAIMFLGRYITPPSMVVETNEKLLKLGFESIDGLSTGAVSEIGITVIAIFLGMVYLWTFVDTLWPCFIGIFVMGISPYAPMNAVLSQIFGNPVMPFLIAVLLFVSIFTKANIPAYIARGMLVNKFLQGRPWAFTAMLLFTPFILSMYCTNIGTPFLIWPIYNVIFESVGYKKGDKYVTTLIMFSMVMVLCGFCSDILKGGAFLSIAGLNSSLVANPNLEMEALSFLHYFGFAFSISILILFCSIFLMRYVFIVNVDLLKDFDIEILNKANPLPPLAAQQKAVIGLFMLYIVWLLAPSFLPKGSFLQQFAQVNLNGGMFVIIALACFIHINDKPLGDLTKNVIFSWGSFFLIGTSLGFGAIVSAPVTGISLYLEFFLGNIFAGVSYTTLIVGVIFIGIVLTNMFNSVVTALILGPILVSLCNVLGYQPEPLIVCFFYSTLFAIITPAGSPFAAMLFANDLIRPKDVFFYGSITTLLVVVIIIFIGIPVTSVIFG